MHVFTTCVSSYAVLTFTSSAAGAADAATSAHSALSYWHISLRVTPVSGVVESRQRGRDGPFGYVTDQRRAPANLDIASSTLSLQEGMRETARATRRCQWFKQASDCRYGRRSVHGHSSRSGRMEGESKPYERLQATFLRHVCVKIRLTYPIP